MLLLCVENHLLVLPYTIYLMVITYYSELSVAIMVYQSPAPNVNTATNMPTNAGGSLLSVTQSIKSSDTQVLLEIVRVPVRGKCVSDAKFFFIPVLTGPMSQSLEFTGVDLSGLGPISHHVQPLVVIHLVRLQRSLASVLLSRGLLFLKFIFWVPLVKVFIL